MWFEQRLEFKEGSEYLRPGPMLAVSQDSRTDTLLFLHTDGGSEASTLGNLARMLSHALSLKIRLDEIAKGKANLLVLGDLNTMGMQYPRALKAYTTVTEKEEIEGLADWAQSFGKQKRKADVVVLREDWPATWTNGKKRSNLDHVLASSQMKFEELGKDADGNPAEVEVEGWWDLKGQALKVYLGKTSDHCSLLFHVID